jgi:TBC1 domain family protein 5
MNSRWLRLIFTRELPFSSALRIWDGVFAEDPQLQLLDFICIAMLLLIRNEREYACDHCSTLLTEQSSRQTIQPF